MKPGTCPAPSAVDWDEVRDVFLWQCSRQPRKPRPFSDVFQQLVVMAQQPESEKQPYYPFNFLNYFKMFAKPNPVMSAFWSVFQDQSLWEVAKSHRN